MKPRIGIFGLSGCWGEQIVILSCEDQLLDIVGATEIVDFLGASSVRDTEAPLDIAFVEGSVGNRREEAALRTIRKRAGLLLACGTCACFGGIAAMAGSEHQALLAEQIYGPMAGRYDIGNHRPLSAIVAVDLAITGCPMEKEELLGAVASLLNGDRPPVREYPVCLECKANGYECTLLVRKRPCLGPITAAGCAARCPGHNVPCIGCRGPVREANVPSMHDVLARADLAEQDIRSKLRTFAAPALDGIGEETAL